jgi:hypothetical protein
MVSIASGLLAFVAAVWTLADADTDRPIPLETIPIPVVAQEALVVRSPPVSPVPTSSVSAELSIDRRDQPAEVEETPAQDDHRVVKPRAKRPRRTLIDRSNRPRGPIKGDDIGPW